jgi:hypothetical protein
LARVYCGSGGSILLVILLHASGNTWAEVLSQGPAATTASAAGWTEAAVFTVAALVAVWITWRRASRAGGAATMHLTDVAAPTRREPSDVPQERISVLDIARGIAILGTLATNVWIFTDPAGMIGYLQRPLPVLTGGLDQTVQTLARQLANGKFLGMLTLMFGIGLELQRRSARRRGQAVARPLSLAGDSAVPGRIAALRAGGGV